MCQGYCGAGIELVKYLGRDMYLVFSYCTLFWKAYSVWFQNQKKKPQTITATCDSIFYSSVIIVSTSRVQPSYFYLEDYLPQTLGSVVYILFSFSDASERPISKGWIQQTPESSTNNRYDTEMI